MKKTIIMIFFIFLATASSYVSSQQVDNIGENNVIKTTGLKLLIKSKQ
jgi:hypothetical protein